MWKDFTRCFSLPPDLHDSAYANFMAWEKLRLYYNGALVALSLLLMALLIPLSGVADDPESLAVALGSLGFTCLGGAVAVNLAYCVGPVAEGYLVMFRVERKAARMVLFTLGLIAGSGLALLAIAICVFSSAAAF
jgi:hypothetical protein